MLEFAFCVYSVFFLTGLFYLFTNVVIFFCQPPHAGKLLSVLKHMPQKYGPDAFFNFPGKSAAVCRYFKFLVCLFIVLLRPLVILIRGVLCLICHCHRVLTKFCSLPDTYTSA